MTQDIASEINSIDRLKLPFNFDSEKMWAEFEALKAGQFEYYNVIQLRAPAHMVDTTLPFPPPADDYANGSWTDWLDTPQLKQSPYFTEIIDTFKKHTKVTLVRLLRLAPMSIVKEHTDPTLALEIERSVIRLTVPIFNNEKVQFFLNGEEVPMKAGECWYLKLNDPHRVVNDGDTERVNLTIDMIPNEWLKSLIKESIK
ncbi:Aspartyl/Asparaginyl beta-hydroxylase [Spirosomataceae bacterium TFI 002]|nr:Aspartyl/Asparaginyl beta-hydroxylase [Spirosomataceae bacterium TFI 002]